MDRVTLADQIAPIMKDVALMPIKEGHVELREPKVMKVVVAGVPEGARVINLRKIGRLSGIRDGPWKKSCDHLRSVCRIEYGASPRRVPARYVMIGEKPSPRLAKQRVSGGHAIPNVSHEGITIQRFVGSRLRFSWLKGDRK